VSRSSSSQLTRHVDGKEHHCGKNESQEGKAVRLLPKRVVQPDLKVAGSEGSNDDPNGIGPVVEASEDVSEFVLVVGELLK
jgi:hypothetical protein